MSSADVPSTHTIPTFAKQPSNVFFFTLDLSGVILNYPPNSSEEEKQKLRISNSVMEAVFATSTPTPFLYDPYSYRVLRYDSASNAFSEPQDALKIDLDYSFSIGEAFGKKNIFGLYVYNSPLSVTFGKKFPVYYPTILELVVAGGDASLYRVNYILSKANYLTPSNPAMVVMNLVKKKYEKLGTARVLLGRISMTISKNPIQFQDATAQAYIRSENVVDVIGDSYKIDLNSLTCIFLSGNQELMSKKVTYEYGVLSCGVNPLLTGDHDLLIIANNAHLPEPVTGNTGYIFVGLIVSMVAISLFIIGSVGIFFFIRKKEGSRLLSAPTTSYDSVDV